MRRSIFAALLLGACATTAPSVADPAVLRGCWIERKPTGVGGEFVTTQRWSLHDGVWQGVQLFYAPGMAPDPASGWEVRRAGEGFQLCQVEFTMASAPPCLNAFFGPGHAADDTADWAEIDAGPEHLRLAIVVSGHRSVLFDGRRDGCD